MSEGSIWVSEKWENLETRYSVKSVIYDEKSDFQHVQVVDTHLFGRMLILDGIVQVTERDEFIYHEMMVHVPMLAHQEPVNVLIIGGGDGGILREVLRHKNVKKAVLVEIDSSVIDLCRRYLPSIGEGSFDDKRTDLVIADGADYVKETNEKFDVVIVDSPDPVGPARVLFANRFYRDIHGIMNRNGIMVRQTGSIALQPDEQKEAHDVLKKIYGITRLYVFTIPTYVGGLFSAVFCSDITDPANMDEDLLMGRLQKNEIHPRYYNPGLHRGAFHIPGFIKERLK